MKELELRKEFKKELAKQVLNDKNKTKLQDYIKLLLESKELPKEARDHQLIGNYKDFREFHLSSDLLVIYQALDEILILVRIGSHSQLF